MGSKRTFGSRSVGKPSLFRIGVVAVIGGLFGFGFLWFAPYIFEILPFGSLPRRGIELVLEGIGMVADGLAQLLDPMQEVLYASDSNYGYTIFVLSASSVLWAGVFVLVYLALSRFKRRVLLKGQEPDN